MANDDAVIKALINVLRDGEKGFADIGEHIKDPAQRTYFMQEAQVRGGYATELERTINFVTDANVHETGTIVGAIHRTVGDLKAHLGASDHSLLESAEQGEDTAKKAYKEALNDTSVSDTVRALIAQQYEHVQQSHDKVKAMRDSTVA